MGRSIARRWRWTSLLVAVVCLAISPRAAAQASTPSKAAIQAILDARVEALAGRETGIGLVVGVIGPKGREVVSSGRPKPTEVRAFGGDTVFEIGSVGKVFTALLLAEMAGRGEVALEEPISKHLPDLRIPTRDGRFITLVDLATHTSALPFMPPPEADLRAFLAGYELPYEIGSRWEYSNLGYWLLGEGLASRARREFTELLHDRIIGPLKLPDTGFTHSARMTANLAAGHDGSLRPSPPSATLPMYSRLQAAGAGLFSTVNDLLRLLAVAMGYEDSPLHAAFAASIATRRPDAEYGGEQALGWLVIGQGKDRLILHEGGTNGYASCVVWDPLNRVGVVVLSNQVASVTDIARHLLRPEVPIQHPVVVRKTEITLDSRVLDTYAGKYEATGEGVFVVTRTGEHLTLQLPDDWGLPPMRIRAESPHEFFASELPLRVTFQTDPSGRVTGMLVHPPRGQKPVPARRIGG